MSHFPFAASESRAGTKTADAAAVHSGGPRSGGVKLVVHPQDILAATVHAVRAALGGLKGGAKPPMASPTERATAIRSTDYLTRDARWPDPR